MIDDENKNQQGITAYHGSPHDFDQFDTSKIGTGEGAQRYGHGLYFAEHEPIAKGYRDKLSNYISDEMLQTYFKPGSIIPGYGGMDKILNYDPEKKLVTAQGIDPQGNLSGPIRRHGTMPDLKELNEEFKRRGLDPYAPGHMYEVAIDAHPDHFLDWDKPLSEQSFHIGKSIFDARKDNPTLFNVFKPHLEKDSTGMGFYQSLATQHPNGYQGATDFLQRAGIKGIKYQDAGSRGAGQYDLHVMYKGKPHSDPIPMMDKAQAEHHAKEYQAKGYDTEVKPRGTHNYVVFDHNRVKVKRRYKKGGRIDAYGGYIERTKRSTGGRIPEADKLFKAAKRNLDGHTKSMLNVHDDAIVNALRIAQGRI